MTDTSRALRTQTTGASRGALGWALAAVCSRAPCAPQA